MRDHFLQKFTNSSPDRTPWAVGLAMVFLASLKYLQVIIYSQEKWFHFAIIAMVAFAGFQIHQFLNSMSQYDQ